MHPLDLADQLRAVADAISSLHTTEPLPDLYVGLSVQVTRDDAPQADRIRAVVRLNEALGRSGHHVEANTLVGDHTWEQPYAYTALDEPAFVPVADLVALAGGAA